MKTKEKAETLETVHTRAHTRGGLQKEKNS